MIIYNKTCCSVILFWKNSIFFDKTDIKYKLYQKEGTNYIGIVGFEKIYEGIDNIFEVTELKQKTKYTFKLEIISNSKNIEEIEIEVETLPSPAALLSNESLDIANGKITENQKILSDEEKKIIGYCSRIVYGKNEPNEIVGEIEGVIIKINHSIINNNDIYYLCFNLEADYFNTFVKIFIENSNKNVNIPCHFIFEKLPTYLIFHLLKKGTVIFTGELFGGVIAASIAFSILNMGKKLNKKYNNAFNQIGKNNIGVVTFGSPSFLNNGSFGLKEKEFIPFFYNIKDEFDDFPELIDFINSDHIKDNNLLKLLQQKNCNADNYNYLKKLCKELLISKSFSQFFSWILIFWFFYFLYPF